MNDYSKTFFHLDKSESFMNKRRLNTENKSEVKFEKYKKVTKTKDNLGIKHRLLKKMGQQNAQKIHHTKKLSTSNFIKEKYKSENKKLSHNKSFNFRRKKPNDINLKINNTYIPKEKNVKKINFSNNNNEIFFDNYNQNKLNRRISTNNNENNNILQKINNTSQIDGKKFSNSYFSSIYKKEKNDDFFSRSQNFGNKKNVLRRINTNYSVNKDKYKKSIFNLENEFNKSQANIYDNKKHSNDFFRPNLLINSGCCNNDNYNFVTEANINNEETNSSNNFNSITTKGDNNTPINNHKPIKLYKDNNNNNTTLNLPGSFNFHQYFNTIINKSNNNKRNGINMNYNKNLASIESNNKLYNNSQYCQTQIYNANESENKLNTLTINDSKLIEEVNDIKNELDNKLSQNPTNSKSKKYNTLKGAFEKFITTLKEYFINNDINPIFIFLNKLLIGYHNVVLAFSTENRKLKELNYKLSEQYQKIDKTLIECNKNIKEKQIEIDNLGKKISFLINQLTEQKKINFILKNKLEEINVNNKDNIKNNLEIIKMKENEAIKIVDEKDKNEQFYKISNINMNNLDDLDALYFFDKIAMKPKRFHSAGKIIPFLPIINIHK